jgi:triosephosphate isomerase (TIM)
MKNIVIANWKMNPIKLSHAKKLIEGYKKIPKNSNIDIVICPPAPFINLFVDSKRMMLGVQNVSTEKEGAFTGEISAPMVKSFGAKYCIVGHSERRAMGETSEIVAKKAVACLQNGISPIVCIGEKSRDASAEHWQEIKWQLVDSLQNIPKQVIKKCIIAYEPIWAIGKKSHGPMLTDDVSESAIFIRKILTEMFGSKIADCVRIVYGGSVDTQSAKNIAKSQCISGFLVGRASLSARDFLSIIESTRPV